MALDAATTSAPPSECSVSFNSPLNNLPSSGSKGSISVGGGFLRDNQKIVGHLERLASAYQERISNHWLARGGWVTNPEPCVTKAPLAIRMVLDEGTWTGEIPAEALPSRPLFGSLWLELKGTTFQVRLSEENGKTSYGANVGWYRDTTDKGVIAEVTLRKQAP